MLEYWSSIFVYSFSWRQPCHTQDTQESVTSTFE
jgi:hypothetical protein